AVAADDNQAVEIELAEVLHAPLRHVVNLDAAIGQLDRVRERVGAIARAEDRAAARQDVVDVVHAEVGVLLLVEALEPVPDTDDLPAKRVARVEGDGADDAVEARAVAAARQDADACAHAAANRNRRRRSSGSLASSSG